MDVSVMAETKLTSLIATPNDKVVGPAILDLDDATVFDCKDLLGTHWELLSVWQQRWLLELLEANLSLFGPSDNDLITH